jgi:hypothetical protein
MLEINRMLIMHIQFRLEILWNMMMYYVQIIKKNVLFYSNN